MRMTTTMSTENCTIEEGSKYIFMTCVRCGQIVMIESPVQIGTIEIDMKFSVAMTTCMACINEISTSKESKMNVASPNCKLEFAIMRKYTQSFATADMGDDFLLTTTAGIMAKMLGRERPGLIRQADGTPYLAVDDVMRNLPPEATVQGVDGKNALSRLISTADTEKITLSMGKSTPARFFN